MRWGQTAAQAKTTFRFLGNVVQQERDLPVWLDHLKRDDVWVCQHCVHFAIRPFLVITLPELHRHQVAKVQAVRMRISPGKVFSYLGVPEKPIRRGKSILPPMAWPLAETCAVPLDNELSCSIEIKHTHFVALMAKIVWKHGFVQIPVDRLGQASKHFKGL